MPILSPHDGTSPSSLPGSLSSRTTREWPKAPSATPESLWQCRGSLTTHARESLWTPDAHSVLYGVGTSLLNAHLHNAASTYWEHMVAKCERLLGDEHPHTLTTRGNLAASYQQAGRTDDAINLLKQALAEYERLLGNEHPDTLLLVMFCPGGGRRGMVLGSPRCKEGPLAPTTGGWPGGRVPPSGLSAVPIVPPCLAGCLLVPVADTAVGLQVPRNVFEVL
ncbi:tetratricopeptide repeat protein [Streptomyces sp. NPDC001933]|uniref:tetratricopeptide repeat protein n=1 Tax=Streptomyces sp. NPDC001933 TaxID=3364626 RepID=UPI0036745F72